MPSFFSNVSTSSTHSTRSLLLTGSQQHMDEHVGELVALLQKKAMYDITLIVAMSSDNGGPVYFRGTSGANNWPLRGGKMNNGEGGIRVNAFASGGFVPQARRGMKEEGLSAVWDWYATFW